MRRATLSSTLLLIVAIAACGGPLPTGSSGIAPSPTPERTGPPASRTTAPSQPPSVVAGPRLGWARTGDLPAANRLLPWWFSEGYLAIGSTEPGDDETVVWFSPDGRTWESSSLADVITPCPGWEPRAAAHASDGWAAGGGAVLLGIEYIDGASECGTERVVAWRTANGRDWAKSSDFDSADLLGLPAGVWATPGGWEAAVQEASGAISVWASAGADRWQRTATLAESELDSFGGVAVSGLDGRRLVALQAGESLGPTLVGSTDGRTWSQVSGPPLESTEAAYVSISRMLGPDGPAPFWLLAMAIEGDDVRTVVSTSTDLSSWQMADFPMPLVAAMAHTSEGILALGVDPCRDTGGPCATDPSQYFLSRDGLTWEPLLARVGPTSFVEGPAGVVGLGDDATWELITYTDEEALLLAGIREDARFACGRRESLPAGAVAGVECAPAGGPADSVGAFLFPSRESMLATYFERLDEQGVAPESGTCPDGPGDRGYVPTDGDPASAPHRVGCFVNEFGNANYRITYPESSVYVGVLGRDGDLATLDAWIWQGNLDTPGSPTIWRAAP